MHQANERTLGILDLVAKEEPPDITWRTKAAPCSRQTPGRYAGEPEGNGPPPGHGKGQAVAWVKQKAQDFAQDLREMREDTRMGLQPSEAVPTGWPHSALA